MPDEEGENNKKPTDDPERDTTENPKNGYGLADSE